MKLVLLTLAGLLASAPARLPAEPCSIEGDGDSAGGEDLELALSACEVARDRFARLFGNPVPPVRVVLWERAGYRAGVQGGAAVVFWPTTSAMEERGAAAAAEESYARLQWEEVLPHEVAHVLLAARFWGRGLGAAAPDGGYATPFPDWLDEGVAIWAEPDAARRGRLDETRELPEHRKALSRILTASHPAAYDARVLALRDGGAAPDDPDLEAFYPQAIAVLGFVYQAGGSAAMRELARRLVADPADPQPLLGLPGLGSDPEELERAWRAWLEDVSLEGAAVP